MASSSSERTLASCDETLFNLSSTLKLVLTGIVLCAACMKNSTKHVACFECNFRWALYDGSTFRSEGDGNYVHKFTLKVHFTNLHCSEHCDCGKIEIQACFCAVQTCFTVPDFNGISLQSA